MQVFDPNGITEVTVPFAPRLASLEGKRIGLLSNQMWQAEKALRLLQDALQQRFPTASFHFIPAGGEIQADRTVAAIAREGCDAVVVGAAA
jgi:hypothetical protein